MSSFLRRLVTVSTGTVVVLSMMVPPGAADHLETPQESQESTVFERPWWDTDDDSDWSGGDGGWWDDWEDEGAAEDGTTDTTDSTTDWDGSGDGYTGIGNTGDTGDPGWGDGDEGDWSDLAGFAANNGSEGGFWVLTRRGEVFALDGAPTLGSPKAKGRYVGLASHPRKGGYWVLDSRGRVSAFGVKNYGSARFNSAVGLAVLSSGNGYWIASRGGKVRAFGKAKPYGGLARLDVTVDRIIPRHDADGYELRTTAGRWYDFPQQKQSHGGGRNNRDRDRDDDEREKNSDSTTKTGNETGTNTGTKTGTNTGTKTPTNGISKTFWQDGVKLATVRQVTVAYSFADNVLRLMRHAERNGRRLGGWGYRSTARQIELRRAHCGTSRYAIYQMPSSSCNPPTARPGSSMHEQGLAIDFYKRGRNGAAISIGGTKEFYFLKRHAHKYGLYNLPSEPWHWSTNGR